MKKFIAPTVRVIKYESNIICESPREDSGSIDNSGSTEGSEDEGFYAPSRRIFGE